MNVYVGKRDCVNRKLPATFNNSQSIADRKYGDRYEKKFHRIIEEWCECKFDDGKTGWEQMDFINKENKLAFELKRRRIKKFQYNDIIISYSKYQYARNLMRKGYAVYFFWKFTDELCFWKVPTILPKSVRIDKGGTYKRGFREVCDCLYIPMSDLLNFKEFPSYIDYMETNKLTNI
jgi:hypothetical protein